MFFPSFEHIDSSLEFIIHIVELSFKHATNKIENKSDVNSFFFELLKKDLLEDLFSLDATYKYEDKFSNSEMKKIIFKNFISSSRNSLDDTYYIRDCLILFFIFNYKINFNSIRDKYISLTLTGDSNSLKYHEEFFKSISFFQENFIGNFFLSDMMSYIKRSSSKSTSVMMSKLENVIVNYKANIKRLLSDSLIFIICREDLETTHVDISMKFFYPNKDQFIINISRTFTKFDMSSESNTTMHSCDYFKWRKLFDKNQIFTAKVSIQILNNHFTTNSNIKLNYNDVFSAGSNLIESKLDKKDMTNR